MRANLREGLDDFTLGGQREPRRWLQPSRPRRPWISTLQGRARLPHECSWAPPISFALGWWRQGSQDTVQRISHLCPSSGWP